MTHDHRALVAQAREWLARTSLTAPEVRALVRQLAGAFSSALDRAEMAQPAPRALVAKARRLRHTQLPGGLGELFGDLAAALSDALDRIAALTALAGIDPMTVREIVRQYLATSGLDGLYNRDGACACLVADLAPCGEIRESCEAGKRVPCDGTLDGCPCGFHVVSAIGVDLTEIPTPCCPLTPDEEMRP